ncbi:MAG: acyltransferase [Pseudomonadales bacterium]
MSSTDGVFQSFSQFLSIMPGKFGVYARAAFYSLACTKTSSDICISFLTLLSHADTEIEQGVYIGPQGNIGKCRIGKNCLFGSGVHILSGKSQHDFSDINTPIQEQGGNFVKITIGEDSWVGNNAVVMANVGPKCVVAAGSVVTRDVEEFSIVAGNPATIIKKRN